MQKILNWRAYEVRVTNPVFDLSGKWVRDRQYLISRRADRVDVLRFYMEEDPGQVALIDYEILDPTISDDAAIQLIIWTYFHDFTRDRYIEKIDILVIGPQAGMHQLVPLI